MLQPTFSSVETRRSWVVAAVALSIMAIAFSAPWVTLVALKDIAAEVRGELPFFVPADASASEGRSEKITLKKQAKAKYRINLKSFRFGAPA